MAEAVRGSRPMRAGDIMLITYISSPYPEAYAPQQPSTHFALFTVLIEVPSCSGHEKDLFSSTSLWLV